MTVRGNTTPDELLSTLFDTPAEQLTLIHIQGLRKLKGQAGLEQVSPNPHQWVDGMWAFGANEKNTLEHARWRIAEWCGLSEGSAYPADSSLLKAVPKDAKTVVEMLDWSNTQE